MKRSGICFLVIIACVTFACGSGSPAVPQAQPEVETIVAETLQALTSVASTPAAPVYQFENISISIPEDVGTGITPGRTTDVELPYINPSNGPMPEHVVLEITGYPLGDRAHITVFKAAEYAAYSELTRGIVTTLQTQPYQDGQPISDALSLGALQSQAKSLASHSGPGLRYISVLLLAVGPISYDPLFYYYQGVTNDGVYFITAVLDIDASSLALDGIPYPDAGTAQDYENYFAAVAEKLNAADQGAFHPSLNSLDALIQSIAIQ